MTRWLLSACVVTLFIASAVAQTSPGSGQAMPRPRVSDTIRLLNQRIPEVIFDGAPFEDVMNWVAEITGANVVVRWQALTDSGIERDKPITVKVKNLRLSQVLWMIMNEAGGSDLKLAYRASGMLLILSTEEDLSKEMLVKVYDVGDLLLTPPRFTNATRMDPAQSMSQGGGQMGGGMGGGSNLFQSNQNQNEDQNRNQDQDADIERLVDLITNIVEPDSWVAGGGNGQIFPFRNTLVVYNTLLVHQRIGGYLEEGAVGP